VKLIVVLCGDISHPEDHIASVNQTLLNIKANDKPIMVFNKIDAYTP
jgi:GTP-binding protein HflX